ncbi:hypothetical protein B0H14DRAFT_3434495 [Mycena olivaceomarginata]|nr:hypothetical protein B0H14DRAFT_3434495 [Mycena olivaceomarginata]
MDLDGLVRATAALHLAFHCCDDCCQPQFVFLPGDPAETELSALSKRKFYVVKKGAPGGEAIYSHWDLAKTQVLGIRGALHESCPTADDARRIWAEYCHRNHSHGPPVSAPPAYSPVTLSSPRAVVTPSSRPPTLIAPRTSSRIRTPPTTPTPPKFYRVAGSPRVLIGSADAEAELRALGTAASLLIGQSLADVEDDDEVTSGDTSHFYRSHMYSEAAVAELVATQAAGLLVGTSLAAVVD